MKKLLAGIILFLISHSVFAQKIKNQYKHNCWKGDLSFTVLSEKSREEACAEYEMKTNIPIVKFEIKEINIYYHNCWKDGKLLKITSEIVAHDKACEAEGFSPSLKINLKDNPFRLNEKDFKIEYKHSCFPNPQLFPEKSGKKSAYSFTVFSKNPNKLEVCLNEFKKRKLIEETTVVDLKRTCLLDTKTSDCFSDFQEELKKLGCDFEQIECESSYSLGVSGPETKACGYVSKKCRSSSTQTCPQGFNPRYLESTKKEIICVKSFDRKGREEQSSVR